MEEKKNIMDYDTVSLDDENSAVVIIDQTKLPGTTEIIALKTAQEIWDAIYLLQVSMYWQKELIQTIMMHFMQSSKNRKNTWILPVRQQLTFPGR